MHDTCGIPTPAIATRIGFVERTGDMMQGALIAQTRQMIDLNLFTPALSQTAMDRQPHGLPLMATVADGALVATPGLSQSTLPRTSPLRIGVP
ncbi:hypothetical protein HK15_00280 [Acetobacter orientalis]|uniref:Uncharacterized protein n=2 Tax=Acetobacter orientalis TaxID=146474 RepID=A0A252B1N2_9PROT|nr:hypothetical protein HK15_00280 [Acetobacter orientalis]